MRTAGEEGRGRRDEEGVSSLQVGRTRTTEREGGKGGGGEFGGRHIYLTCDATAPRVSLIEDRGNEHGRQRSQRRNRHTRIYIYIRAPRRLSSSPSSSIP